MKNKISCKDLKDIICTIQVCPEEELDKLVDDLTSEEKDFLLKLLIQKVRGNPNL